MSTKQDPLEELLEKARASGLVMGARYMLVALEEVALRLKHLEKRVSTLEGNDERLS